METKENNRLKSLHDDVRDNWPMRQGKNDFLRHLAQENLTRKEALIAACYHCCGGYEGGAADCKSVVCPLYPFMPYRDDIKRNVLPEEQRAQLIARLQAGRERAKAADPL